MHPELFSVPGVDWEVQSYGFFAGLALLVGWVLTLSQARRDDLPADALGTVYVVSVAAGLIGARAVWVLQHPSAYDGWRSLVTLQAGTLAPFAGVIVALGVSAALVQRRGVPVLAWFDVLTPAFAVGYGLERLGAFLAGSGHGIYAPGLAWAVRFPPGSPAYAAHRRALDALLPAGSPVSLPVHPTQLYGLALALAGIALWVFLRRRRRFTGQIFLGYALYFLVARSLIEEWFRADAASAAVGPFNPGQAGSLIMIAVLSLLYRGRSKRRGGS